MQDRPTMSFQEGMAHNDYFYLFVAERPRPGTYVLVALTLVTAFLLLRRARRHKTV